MSELPNPAPEALPNIYKASEILIERMVLLGGFSAENNKVRASTSSCSLGAALTFVGRLPCTLASSPREVLILLSSKTALISDNGSFQAFSSLHGLQESSVI